MSNTCSNCKAVLSEDIKSGRLIFKCNTCNNLREARNDETLRQIIDINNNNNTDIDNPNIIINNITNSRVKINCKCGYQMGVLYMEANTYISYIFCYKCGLIYNS